MKKTTFFILRPLLYLISLLPFGIIYLISDLLYFFLYYIFKYRKKVVYENLRKSFPEKSKTEIEVVAKNFYRFLSDQVLESIKMLSISQKTVKQRFRLNNVDEIHKHFRENKAVIAVTGHYGKCECGCLVLSILV